MDTVTLLYVLMGINSALICWILFILKLKNKDLVERIVINEQRIDVHEEKCITLLINYFDFKANIQKQIDELKKCK